MIARLLVVAVSAAALGLAGWAAWSGVGIADGDVARSARTGSVGPVGVVGYRRVK